MSKKGKHIEERKQELLQKFLDRKISKDEQFELEKFALDDDFLFDALEGFHGVEHSHAESMEQVNKKIKQRIQKNPKRKLSVLYWKVSSVAAVLMILVAITFVVKNHTLTESEEVFAKIDFENNKKAELYGDSSDLTSVLTSAENIKPTVEARKEALESIEEEEQFLDAETSVLESPVSKNVEASVEEVSVEKMLQEVDNNQVDFAEDKVLEKSPGKDSYKAKKREAVKESQVPEADIVEDDSSDELIDYTITNEEIRVGNAFIEGKVISEDGEPIIGANVQIPETNQGTMTDLDGNFNIDVPKDAQELEISYTGFNNVKVAIDGVSNLAVTLKEGTLLSEVVVVNSYKLFNSAVPDGGFEEFNLYVTENLIKPREAIEAGVAGTVIIEFSVGPYGKLSNFRVIKSLGYGCDEEALRILQNGVNWETFPKFKSMKTQYQFYF